jgi:hypothetical protein
MISEPASSAGTSVGDVNMQSKVDGDKAGKKKHQKKRKRNATSMGDEIAAEKDDVIMPGGLHAVAAK